MGFGERWVLAVLANDAVGVTLPVAIPTLVGFSGQWKLRQLTSRELSFGIVTSWIVIGIDESRARSSSFDLMVITILTKLDGCFIQHFDTQAS